MCGMLAAMTACMLTGFTVSADTDRWKSTTARDANGNISVTFPDLVVTLPSDWAGNCQMGTSDDEVAFYQTKSRQLYTEEYGSPSGGWLFSICFSEDDSFKQYASYQALARVNDGYYFVSFPTDVQGYIEDQEAMDEYCDMSGEVEWVADNITVTREDAVVVVLDDEYIFPHSSYEYLTEAELYGMTADELQMAINEIYARYGRKFVRKDIQEYFDSKSWYYGFIEAADFDVSIISQTEWANIELLLKCMKTAPTTSSDNIEILTAGQTDCYGMIIEKGSGYFIVRQQDGTSIQFWYDGSKLPAMGIADADLAVGETVSLMYTDSYEAVNILVF